MHAQRQAVAGGVDLVEQVVERVALVTQHVQHRAEYLALQLAQLFDFDQRRRHEVAFALRRRVHHRGLADRATCGAHRGDVALDVGLRVGVDHRPHVDRQRARVAHAKLAHRTVQHFDQPRRDLALHAQHAQRRAALAGAVEGRRQYIGHHLLGQCRRVDHHRVLTPRLGNQRHAAAVGSQPAGQRALQNPRDLGRAGEEHALYPPVGHQCGAHRFATTRQQLQHAVRHAGCPQRAHGSGCDKRRLLGRLGEHGVAGGQRRGHLAGEDRQRKIPRADAHDRAQRAVRRVVEVAPHQRAVVAQEVNRLAHLGHRIGASLAGFAREQGHQRFDVGFERVGGTPEHRRARGRGGVGPGRRRVGRAGYCGLHVVGRGLLHLPHHIAPVGRIEHRLRPTLRDVDAQQRRGRPCGDCAVDHRTGQRRQPGFAGQVDAARVDALVRVQRARQGDRWMRQAHAVFAICHLLHRVHRVLHQVLQRDAVVGDLVDERGVGAVLEQASHQVRQQRVVRAHRRVDAARPRQLARGHRAHHLFVQRLAHPVQALEFVLAGVVVLPRQRVDRGQRVGVVGRELRVHRFGRGEQLARTGDVGDVGVGLAREDRIAVLAIELRALDLAVPVRALDQSDHQAMLAAARQIDEVVDHGGAALLIRLHDEADAVPAGERALVAQAFEQVERQLQPLGLFGVDVQADVVAARQIGQVQQARVELGRHAFHLRAAVTRVQCRQLDRDAGALVDAAAGRRRADGVDRLFVGVEVGLRVLRGHRRFAEHVVGVAKALGLAAAGVAQRLLDRLAGDELLAHQAHRHVHAAADQWLAATADDAAQRRAQAHVAVRGHQLAGEQQAPGGGVDEQRLAAAQVRLPVAAADLVADQRVAGRRVGNAQQRLGQAHQRHTFLRAERELLQQALHQPGTAAVGLALAHAARDAQRQRLRRAGLIGRLPRQRQQRGQHVGFGLARGRGDGSALRTGQQTGRQRPQLRPGETEVVGRHVRFRLSQIRAAGDQPPARRAACRTGSSDRQRAARVPACRRCPVRPRHRA